MNHTPLSQLKNQNYWGWWVEITPHPSLTILDKNRGNGIGLSTTIIFYSPYRLLSYKADNIINFRSTQTLNIVNKYFLERFKVQT